MPNIAATLALPNATNPNTNAGLARSAATVDVNPTVAEVQQFINKIHGPSLTSPQRQALVLVSYFLTAPGALRFPNFQRQLVCLQLAARVVDFALIYQGARNLCGPATLLYDIARRNPRRYVSYVVNLLQHGRAVLRTMQVVPGDNVRASTPPPHGEIPQVDYIAIASLRSATAILGYDRALTSETLQAATLGSTLASWMRSVNYTNVVCATSSGWERFWRAPTRARRMVQGQASANTGSLHDAAGRLAAGDTVILIVSINLARVVFRSTLDPLLVDRSWGLTTARGRENFFNAAFAAHFVLLRDIIMGPAGVRFQFTTWGRTTNGLASAVTIPYSKVASWYWGYVAGNPNGL